MEKMKTTHKPKGVIELSAREIKALFSELIKLHPGKLELHITIQTFGNNSPIAGSVNSGSIGGNLVTSI